VANPDWTDPMDWEDKDKQPPECDTCNDTGVVLEAARWSGEAYGELVEKPCPDCNT
jgi:DnaJ-class molecular chaperone